MLNIDFIYIFFKSLAGLHTIVGSDNLFWRIFQYIMMLFQTITDLYECTYARRTDRKIAGHSLSCLIIRLVGADSKSCEIKSRYD